MAGHALKLRHDHHVCLDPDVGEGRCSRGLGASKRAGAQLLTGGREDGPGADHHEGQGLQARDGQERLRGLRLREGRPELPGVRPRDPGVRQGRKTCVNRL